MSDALPDAADGATGNTGATRLCIEGEAPIIRRTTIPQKVFDAAAQNSYLSPPIQSLT